MTIYLGTYPWAFDISGGGERQLMDYHNYLTIHGTKNRLYNMWNPNLDDCHIFHYFSTMPSSKQFLDYIKTNRHIPLIVSPNFWPEPDEWKKSGVFDEVATILWLANRIIVNSFIEEEAMVRLLRIDSSQIRVVPNGVDALFFEPISQGLFRNTYNVSGPYILNVGNIEPRKNQHAFLEALRAFPEYKFVVIGNVRAQWYKDACVDMGRDQFIHIDALPHESEMLRSAFSGCEFFAMPSLVETPSIASLEAAASGAKLLSTSRGSAPEYFKDMATYVDPLDLSSLRTGICTALSSTVNPHLKSHIQTTFGWDSVIRKLLDVYKDI